MRRCWCCWGSWPCRRPAPRTPRSAPPTSPAASRWMRPSSRPSTVGACSGRPTTRERPAGAGRRSDHRPGGGLPARVRRRAAAGRLAVAGLALARALGAAGAGPAAVAAPLVGLRWSLLPFLLGAAVLLAVALGLRRLDVQLPATVLDGPLGPRPTVPFAGAWIAAAAGVAIAPIVYQAGRADA